MFQIADESAFIIHSVGKSIYNGFHRHEKYQTFSYQYSSSKNEIRYNSYIHHCDYSIKHERYIWVLVCPKWTSLTFCGILNLHQNDSYVIYWSIKFAILFDGTLWALQPVHIDGLQKRSPFTISVYVALLTFNDPYQKINKNVLHCWNKIKDV